MRTWPALLSLSICAAGCGPSQDAAVNSPPAIHAPPAPIAAADPDPPLPPLPRPSAAAQTPMPNLPRVIDLGLYQIQVPAGAVSDNKAFWERIDESIVDDPTGTLLDKNGVRVGSGAVADWPKFKAILDAAGALTRSSRYLAASATDQEIAAGSEQGEQTLFFFDHHGLSGRVYDQCQNLLELSFGPSPAEAHSVRLELSPVVRATRRHYHYTVLNGQTSAEFSSDEHLYDLNLRVDLAPGRFVVIAPSPQSLRATSIGHQFLTQDGNAGRVETVLIFIVYPSPAVRPLAATQPRQ